MTFTRITRALLRKAKALHSQALLRLVDKSQRELGVAVEDHKAALRLAQECWKRRDEADVTHRALRDAVHQEIGTL